MTNVTVSGDRGRKGKRICIWPGKNSHEKDMEWINKEDALYLIEALKHTVEFCYPEVTCCWYTKGKWLAEMKEHKLEARHRIRRQAIANVKKLYARELAKDKKKAKKKKGKFRTIDWDNVLAKDFQSTKFLREFLKEDQKLACGAIARVVKKLANNELKDIG